MIHEIDELDPDALLVILPLCSLQIEAEDIKELGIDENPEEFLSQLQDTAERLQPVDHNNKSSTDR
jgi:hypothetical protein